MRTKQYKGTAFHIPERKASKNLKITSPLHSRNPPVSRQAVLFSAVTRVKAALANTRARQDYAGASCGVIFGMQLVGNLDFASQLCATKQL